MLAGTINSVAGGGGLIAFPALLVVGIPPINANATNTVGLWFGTAASAIAYRQELAHQKMLWLLSSVSVVGGVGGAYILLHTPEATFESLIPYLMLIGTVLFATGKPLIKWLRSRNQHLSNFRLPTIVVLLLQLAIAIYGGFYGGGVGILMLTVLEVMGIQNMHTMNGMKTWLATCINAAAIVYFMLSQTILWQQAIVMALGSLIGGYGSAKFARQLHPSLIRYVVIGIGSIITAYFFWHQHRN